MTKPFNYVEILCGREMEEQWVYPPGFTPRVTQIMTRALRVGQGETTFEDEILKALYC